MDLAVEVINKYENDECSRKLYELTNSFSSGSYTERLFKGGNYIFKCLVKGKRCIHINPYNVLEISGLSEGEGYKIIYILE